jgi:hypothetical protein
MAPRDARDSADINLRIRGEVSQLGPVVPRNFPLVLHRGPAPEIPEGESGRRQLAEWITSPENALLDRVMVNRIWHHLFGRGIVSSVDNFGALGAKPTHPELLDYLASEFRSGNGSVKNLVRRLVLSRTYRLSANSSPELAKADPKNEWFGRQNRRRLTAEEIRDSILYLSGRLDSVPGKATAGSYGVDLDKPMSFSKERMRTVYLPVARNNLVAELAMFDAANPDLVSGSRATTTVPTQALFLMNGEFFQEQSGELGNLADSAAKTPSEAVDWLYRRVLNRAPRAEEVENALGFLAGITNDPESGEPDAEGLGHLAHLLLVSTEFLFLN